MKKILYAIGIFLLPFTVYASDVRVLSVQPNYITEYRLHCTDVHVAQDNSALGTALGGLVGGSIGYQSGSKTMTVLGAAVGSIVGNDMGKNRTSVRTTQTCRNVPISVPYGEQITFEYRGRVFTQVVY